MANRRRETVTYRPFRAEPLLADGLLPVQREGGETLRKVSAVFFQFAEQQGLIADAQRERQARRDARRDATAGRTVSELEGQAAPPSAMPDASPPRERGRRFASEVNAAIDEAAGRYGVDRSTLYRIAQIESGGNPRAKNPRSSAGGLFQFIDSTASQYGLADRFDPSQASDAAARLLRDNASYLRRTLGREPTSGELYLAHQQGAGGAAKLLRDPGRPASEVVGADAVRLNGGRPGMTAGQFAQLWINRAEGNYSIPSSAPAAEGGEGRRPVLAGGTWRPSGEDTIYGRAYDEEGARLYLQTLDLEIRKTTGQVYELYKDDPAQMAQAMSELKSATLRDHVFEEIAPEVGIAFDEHSQRYLQQGLRDAEDKARQERVGALDNRTNELRTEIGRALEALDPEDESTAAALESAERALADHFDTAVSEGLLTRPEAEAEKRSSRRSTATRFYLRQAEPLDADGVEALQERMREDFANGKLDGVDDEAWRGLQGELTTLANRKRSEEAKAAATLTAEERIEAARLEALIADDVASVASTGAELTRQSGGPDPQRVLELLGEDRFDKWQRERSFAGRAFQAAAGMEFETPEEIATRLAQLEPAAGMPGFAEAQEIHGAATQRAAQLMKERVEDPALYVLRHQPSMMEAWEQSQEDGGDVRGFGQLMLSAQAEIGIPEDERRVLSAADVGAISKRFLSQEDGGESAALLMRSERQRWGDLWPRVFGELAGELPGSVMVVGAMDLPGQERAAEELAEAIKAGGEATFRKLLPSTSLTDAKERTFDQLVPFMETLGGLPGSEASGTAVMEAVDLLAMRYMTAGDSPARAADRAYEDVIGKKYVIQDGYRVPRILDEDKIAVGARLALADLADGEFKIDLPFSDIDEEGTRASFTAAVIDGGRWVTSPLEDGLTLYAPDGAAVTVDGKPLTFRWGQLTGYRRARANEFLERSGPPSAFNMDYRSMLDRYMRGELTADEMQTFNPPAATGGE
jgi:hypothetical protein